MYKCYLRKGGRIHLRLQCRKLTSLQACNTDTPLECRECRERDYWLAKLQRFQLYIYIYILTWTFQPQQTFHQALPECWRVWQVVVEGMSHTCQCNTGCSKYLSSGVKGPCSMAAIRFYSPVSVLLIMVLHSQAKLGSGIICSCSMSWKASIWLLISWLENTQSLNSACYPHGCGIPELLHLKLLSGILSSFRMITWSLKGILSFQSRRE